MRSDTIIQDLVVEKKRTTGYSSWALFFKIVINISGKILWITVGYPQRREG